MSIKRLPRFLRFVILAIALIIGGLSFALSNLPAAEAQCAPRTDWATYTIQRGDTLARIAARFGTTSSALASANCISNPSRIFWGQRLYVPSTTSPNNPPSIGATFQAFERGFMTWRVDTGEIVVYFTSASNAASGVISSYLSSSYGRLADNPVTTATPAGRFRPAFGFGKVWGNVAAVRDSLGWAITGESGYLMTMTQETGGYRFTLPGGGVASNSGNRTWSLISGSIPGNPGTGNPGSTTGGTTGGNPNVFTTQASFQQFEYGFMTWRADTGEITIYYNTGNNAGEVINYAVNTYAYMPENPVVETPPAGRQRPILGMGKVWGNVPTVRNSLGWATTGEQGYRATFTYPGTNSAQFNIPNGSMISNTSNRVWSVLSGSGVPSVPRPTGTTTGGTTTGGTTTGGTGSTVQAAFQQFEYGFMVWRADTGEVVVYYNTANNTGNVLAYPSSAYAYMSDNPITEVPPSGRIRPTFGFGKVWGNIPAVRNNLGWATGSEQGVTITFRTPSTNTYSFNIPNGSVIANVGNQTWSVASGTGVPSTPRPSGTTTGGTTTGGTTTGGTTGDTVTGTLAIAPYANLTQATGVYSLFNGQSTTLTWTNLPANTTLVNFVLTRSDNTNQTIGNDSNIADGVSATWTVENNVTGTITAFAFNGTTANGRSSTLNIASGAAPSTTTNGAFQQFETGFMVWREDSQFIMVFQSSGSLSMYGIDAYGTLPDNPVTDATPAGRFRPINGFGRVWGNTAAVRTGLGWGTAAEQAYSITFRTVIASSSGTLICFNLPDGRFVRASQSTWETVTACN